jgi:hypothetical protein
MRIKTVMLRQYMDSLYLANNPRYYVNTSKGVNLDDLLMARPGGIVRGTQDDAVVPLVMPHAGEASLNGLQLMDTILEQRTGVTKDNNRLGPDAINKRTTATEVNASSEKANQRIEMIARVFAETGVIDLFRKIIHLGSKYSQKALKLKINGQYTDVDPREWKTQFDFTVNVGVGTGNKDQIVSHLTTILQVQQQVSAAKIGIVAPQHVYEAVKELTRGMGFKDTDKFFGSPDKFPAASPTPPEQVQVAQIKAQSDQQIAQQKAQSDAQMAMQKV